MTAPDPNPDALVWQRLHFPQPLPEAAALALLRHWAAWPHVTQLVLEARNSRSGIRYLVGVQQRHAALARRSVEQLIGGSVVTPEAGSRADVDTARRVALTTGSRPLVPLDAVASVRSILSSLTAVRAGEQLVVQITCGRSYAPSLPPVQPHQAEQSMLSRVLLGLQPEEQPDARAALGAKLAQHAFAATVRIGVSATTPTRRKSLLIGLASAMATSEAPGVHLTLKATSVKRLNQPKSLWPFFAPTQRLTTTEIARLAAWPISDKEEPFPGQPPRHPKPVRPAAAVMTGERVLANANAPGVDGTIGYGVTDALRHTWVIGPNGVGKSTLLLNLICQDLSAGRPVVVIEPKDLVADVLRRIPTDRQDDVVVLDPLDEAPVGINPLHRVDASARGSSPEVVADSLFGTFHSLYGETIGPRSSDILRNCLDVLARRDDASLIMLPLLLTNPGFRRSLTQHAMRDDPFASGPFWQWFDQLTPEATANIVAPLSNKIRPLLDRHLRAVLAQRRPRFNVRQVLTENKILLVPLQKGVIGPEAAQLLGAIVVAELWQAIRERAGTPENARTPVMIYIDEVQDYLRLPTDLGDALATARSLKAGFHVAHQYTGQLPKSMLDAFMNNARSRVCFQLGSGDAKAMAAGQSVLAPEDFSMLPAYHVYASLMRDNTIQPWASGVTQPAPPVTSDPDSIRARSRAAYGQPLDEIEAGFAELLQPAQQGPASGRRRRQP